MNSTTNYYIEKITQSIKSLRFKILTYVRSCTIVRLLTILLYISTIIAIFIMCKALHELRIFDINTYVIEINGAAHVYARHLVLIYMHIIVMIPVLRIIIRDMPKYLHYLLIATNLVISNFTLFSLPKFIENMKALEIAQVDIIQIGRWITIRKLWTEAEILKEVDNQISLFVYEVNNYERLTEEQHAALMKEIAERKNKHSMEEVTQILAAFFKKLTGEQNTPPKNNASTSWLEWVAPYFTAEYYYAGWIAAGAVTAVGIYFFFFYGGGSSPLPPKGPFGTGSYGGASGISRAAGISSTTATNTLTLQETAIAASVAASTITAAKEETKKKTSAGEQVRQDNELATANAEQKTTKSILKSVKHKYEGETPANIHIQFPSFGFEGMMAALSQSTQNFTQQALEKITTIKKTINEIMIDRLNMVRQRKDLIVDQKGHIQSLTFKEETTYSLVTKETIVTKIRISWEGVTKLLRLTDENTVNALTNISETNVSKKKQIQEIENAVQCALEIEACKRPNKYRALYSLAKEKGLTAWKKGVETLKELQEEAVMFITEILK